MANYFFTSQVTHATGGHQDVKRFSATSMWHHISEVLRQTGRTVPSNVVAAFETLAQAKIEVQSCATNWEQFHGTVASADGNATELTKGVLFTYRVCGLGANDQMLPVVKQNARNSWQAIFGALKFYGVAMSPEVVAAFQVLDKSDLDVRVVSRGETDDGNAPEIT